MSKLDCITDDFEEEIARSIKDTCLMVLGKDFDFEDVCRELQHQPIRLKFLGQAVETQAKIAVNYSTSLGRNRARTDRVMERSAAESSKA